MAHEHEHMSGPGEVHFGEAAYFETTWVQLSQIMRIAEHSGSAVRPDRSLLQHYRGLLIIEQPAGYRIHCWRPHILSAAGAVDTVGGFLTTLGTPYSCMSSVYGKRHWQPIRQQAQMLTR